MGPKPTTREGEVEVFEDGGEAQKERETELVSLLGFREVREELFKRPHENAGDREMRASTLRAVVVLEALAFLVTLLGLWYIPNDGEYIIIFRVFYFPLLPLVAMLWLWGVNVQVWTQFRLNYLKVFEVEDRVILPCHEDVFKMAHIFSLIVLAFP